MQILVAPSSGGICKHNNKRFTAKFHAAFAGLLAGERSAAQKAPHFPGNPDEPGEPAQLRPGFPGTQADPGLPRELPGQRGDFEEGALAQRLKYLHFRGLFPESPGTSQRAHQVHEGGENPGSGKEDDVEIRQVVHWQRCLLLQRPIRTRRTTPYPA